MDLSLNDLILKPDTAGTSLLRPSAQRASEAVSLAAFNDLLGQLNQARGHRSDRVGVNESRPSQTTSDLQDVEEVRIPERERTSPSDARDRSDDEDRVGSSENRTREKDPKQASSRESRNGIVDKENQSADATLAAGQTAQRNTVVKETIPLVSPTLTNANGLGATTRANNGTAIGLGGNSAPGLQIAAQLIPNPAAATTVLEAGPGATQPNGPKAPLLPTGADALPDAMKALVSQAGMQGATKSNNSAGGTGNGGASASQPGVVAGSMLGLSDLPIKPEAPFEVYFETRAASAQPRSAFSTGLLAAQEISDNPLSSGMQPGSGIASAAKGGTAQVSGAVPVSTEGAGAGQPSAVSQNSPVEFAAPGTDKALPTASSHASSGNGSPQGIFGAGPGNTTQSFFGSNASSLGAARTAPPVPVPADQFAVHVARAAASGSDQISIKLKPAALGQVDVKLEVTHDGRVAAVVTAEKADTLDLLQRDSRALERALQDAGLKTDSNSLQFSLRGEGEPGSGFGHGSLAPNGSPFAGHDEEEPTGTGSMIAGYQNSRAAQGGIDISV
jgi:flagellar hook-length control protein FliK